MTEGLGMSAMIETPDRGDRRAARRSLHRGSTKTEQGDSGRCWAPATATIRGHRHAPDILDCFKIIPEMHNLADRLQCPIVLTDLLLSRAMSVVPADLDFNVEVDRGELITSAGTTNGSNGYKRYRFTESGVSPRAIPGVIGHTHTAATDEHMEDGVLISDEFTNPVKRRAMMEKRQQKMAGIEASVQPPELIGPPDADVTLIGWGSTQGVIQEAREILAEKSVTANQLQIRWMVPLHGEAIVRSSNAPGTHHHREQL
jgi:2-oxoglutarate ferredoxin oxidoreductase subunit alpha